MFKVDHRKSLKHLYHPSSKTPTLVDVPPMNFLMMDGRGKPNGKGFQQAASTLYPLAYTLKWMVRQGSDIDFHVMPMEVLWKVNRQTKEFSWTMMLMQPEYVTAELVNEARQKVLSKVDSALLEQVQFKSIGEGMCVQFLHIGTYEEMDAAMNRMISTAETGGYEIPIRNTHDIYLNDVRKTKPENLKSIMRLPVVPHSKKLIEEITYETNNR
jgi:hypothetical protein